MVILHAFCWNYMQRSKNLPSVLSQLNLPNVYQCWWGTVFAKPPDPLVTRRLKTVWRREAVLVGLSHGDAPKSWLRELVAVVKSCLSEVTKTIFPIQVRNTFWIDNFTEVVVVLNIVKNVTIYNALDSCSQLSPVGTTERYDPWNKNLWTAIHSNIQLTAKKT